MFRTFRLIGGKHQDEDGKTYKKGDLIETYSDLVALYPNKFEEVKSAPVQVAPARDYTSAPQQAPASGGEQAPASPTPAETDKEWDKEAPVTRKRKVVKG